MHDRLRNAIESLRNLDTSLSPAEFAMQREDALVEGLHGLAEEFGRRICFTCIDANGEMDFNIVGPEGEGKERPSGTYGDDLAQWLSLVPRRTGIRSTEAAVLPENGWCRINHFDVERLLNLVAEARLSRDPKPAACPAL